MATSVGRAPAWLGPPWRALTPEGSRLSPQAMIAHGAGIHVDGHLGEREAPGTHDGRAWGTLHSRPSCRFMVSREVLLPGVHGPSWFQESPLIPSARSFMDTASRRSCVRPRLHGRIHARSSAPRKQRRIRNRAWKATPKASSTPLRATKSLSSLPYAPRPRASRARSRWCCGRHSCRSRTPRRPSCRPSRGGLWR
jgi:hypothetical protein